MEGGLGHSPKALCRSGVWGNAPCSLQEQGFKGLAPWCINNLLEFQQPVPTSKWPVLEYQHCFTTTKWSLLINDMTMSHHCLITITAKCQSCIRGHNFCAPSHCYSCTINVIADAQHSFFFKIITIYPIYPQNTLHLSHINSHHISYFFPCINNHHISHLSSQTLILFILKIHSISDT